MKYIILPIGRFFKVLWIFFFLIPFAFLFCSAVALWEWDFKELKAFLSEIRTELWTEFWLISDTRLERVYYKTPLDMIRGKKTYINKEIKYE